MNQSNVIIFVDVVLISDIYFNLKCRCYITFTLVDDIWGKVSSYIEDTSVCTELVFVNFLM